MDLWIGVVLSLIVACIGWVGVQRTGSYENFWGVLMVWTVPVFCGLYTLVKLFF